MSAHCRLVPRWQKRSAMSEPRWSPKESSALPALVKFSVEPVPKDVEDDLARPAWRVRDGLAIANVYPEVLTAADGYLHLRHYVPVRRCSSHKIASGDELHHGRPQAGQASIGGKALPHCGAPVNHLRRNVGMAR